MSPGKPVLIDKFLESAIEVDVDCLSDGTRAVIGGVMQHIEEAGIHSGDSACVIPPHSLPPAVDRGDQAAGARAGRGAERQGADEHPVRGHRAPRPTATATDAPTVYILEVNPRASRTVPFVSKATGVPLARLAALVMVGKTLDELGVTDEVVPTHFSVKESVFPFNKFPGVDIILGPEMRSTGEVMGIDDTLPDGVRQEPDGGQLRRCRGAGTVFVSVADRDKADGRADRPGAGGDGLHAARDARHGDGPARGRASRSRRSRRSQEGRPNLIDQMKNGEVALVINTPSGRGRADRRGQDPGRGGGAPA